MVAVAQVEDLCTAQAQRVIGADIGLEGVGGTVVVEPAFGADSLDDSLGCPVPWHHLMEEAIAHREGHQLALRQTVGRRFNWRTPKMTACCGGRGCGLATAGAVRTGGQQRR